MYDVHNERRMLVPYYRPKWLRVAPVLVLFLVYVEGCVKVELKRVQHATILRFKVLLPRLD